MPFRSKAQRGYMYANHPDIAKRWEHETPKSGLADKARGRASGWLSKKKKYIAGGMACLAFTWIVGCLRPSQREIDAAYLAEITACAKTAETKAEAELCRAQTKARWGLDGGSDVR